MSYQQNHNKHAGLVYPEATHNDNKSGRQTFPRAPNLWSNGAPSDAHILPRVITPPSPPPSCSSLPLASPVPSRRCSSHNSFPTSTIPFPAPHQHLPSPSFFPFQLQSHDTDEEGGGGEEEETTHKVAGSCIPESEVFSEFQGRGEVWVEEGCQHGQEIKLYQKRSNSKNILGALKTQVR